MVYGREWHFATDVLTTITTSKTREHDRRRFDEITHGNSYLQRVDVPNPEHSFSFFEIVAPLGAGAMGEVYRGHQAQSECGVEVSARPLCPRRGQDGARFQREAQTLAERRMVPVRSYAKGCSAENVQFAGVATTYAVG